MERPETDKAPTAPLTTSALKCPIQNGGGAYQAPHFKTSRLT